MTTPDTNHTYYRFEGLLLAIEFFTQRFDTNQLSMFSFEFVNEILTLHASALFIRENGRYKMKQKRLYADIPSYEMADTEKLRQLATFRGHTMISGFEHIFEKTDMEAFQIRWLLPLIIDDQLHGFIVSSGNISGTFTDDDMVMSNTLMRLINNSLENSMHFAELQKSNSKLDQKNFNLFAINQSTKVLLSEMSLARLHETTTDVFSEVSTSQITSFGTVDPITRRLTIKGYRNVFSYAKFYGDFELKTTKYTGPVVLHMERDRERLDAIFADYRQLHSLEAEYIILIVQQHIIGMVSLSKPVNDERKYDESTFELIESLANSAFIAISNAMQYEEASRQRASAENKLRMLQTLNRLIKNVNESTTREELGYFVLKTLQMTFKVRKALLCLRDGDAYIVTEAIGFPDEADGNPDDGPLLGRSVLTTTDLSEEALEGVTAADYTSRGAAKLLPAATVSWAGEGNCCVIAPLAISNRLVLAEDPYPPGFLIVLDTDNGLQEEETLLIDTVAKSIAPILHQMGVVSAMQQRYRPDGKLTFLETLDKRIEDWHRYSLDFYLYYKPHLAHPFQEKPVEDEEKQRLADATGCDPDDIELIRIDGHLFAFGYEPLNAPEWIEIPGKYDREAVLTYPFV